MRKKNKEIRSREYLFDREIKDLLEVAKNSKYGLRNYLIVLLSYRHGLRVSELCNLKWHQINFDEKKIHINRIKQGLPSVQPLLDDEINSLMELKEQNKNKKSNHIFLSERRTPIKKRTIQSLIAILGEKAGFDFALHHHMLRHSCGFYLANKGIDARAIQDYLGHCNIQHTVRYTKLVGKFEGFFEPITI